MITHARAPVRIDFVGGWSDVPTFADEYGGAVVNAAIARHVMVDVRRDGPTIELAADDLGQTVVCHRIDELVYDGTLDLHKAAVRMFALTGGVKITSSSSVPPGSGLGTSGALDVALVAGLSHSCGRDTGDKAQLAEMAFRLEAIELGLTGGRQDQYASAIGGFLCLDFSRDGVAVQRLNVAEQFVAELQEAMVIVYTGQTHFSSQTHDRVWSAFQEGVPSVRDALHVVRDLAAPTARALEDGDLRALAHLIDENWSQQQRLHPSIATPVTREVEAAARGAGAWGAKATGAGAGGCMIFLGDPGARPRIVDAVSRSGATALDYEFDFLGVSVS